MKMNTTLCVSLWHLYIGALQILLLTYLLTASASHTLSLSDFGNCFPYSPWELVFLQAGTCHSCHSVAAGRGARGAFAPGGTFQGAAFWGAKIWNSENWPFLVNWCLHRRTGWFVVSAAVHDIMHSHRRRQSPPEVFLAVGAIAPWIESAADFMGAIAPTAKKLVGVMHSSRPYRNFMSFLKQ